MATRRVSEDLHGFLANASGYHLASKSHHKRKQFFANPVKAIGSITCEYKRHFHKQPNQELSNVHQTDCISSRTILPNECHWRSRLVRDCRVALMQRFGQSVSDMTHSHENANAFPQKARCHTAPSLFFGHTSTERRQNRKHKH